jgi:hypothetical protein
MPVLEPLRRVDVHAVLRDLRVGSAATFQLRPREWTKERGWRGGEYLQVTRLDDKRYKCGSLGKNLTGAVEFVKSRMVARGTPHV